MSLRSESTDHWRVASPALRGAENAVPGCAYGGAVSSQRLRVNPIRDHVSESYDELELDFSPSIFSSLEKHLPMNMLNAPRGDKLKYLRTILLDYLPPAARIRDQKYREYTQMILSNYKPLNKELYAMNPTAFFVPAFLKAISDNNEDSFRSIVSEPFPGIFTFEMLQPHFCELLLSEVESFERWAFKTKFQIIRPNTMNKYGTVLDDFGLQTMLAKLRENFISPLSKVFFAELGGSTLDAHHGFIVEYGKDRDIDLGFHVDDADITLNVCLGKQFSGGELFFRGMRCDKHINTESIAEEIFDYSHVPGQAVLHHGRHRHGARATTWGHRVNLVLWCRSSAFRELQRYKSDFSSWCNVCTRQKKDRQRKTIDITSLDLFKWKGEATA
ncbi:2-oxoglutarate and iron-dependent oxygenase domain-containing protein CP2-like isoform X1 [Arachis stenosperma]|uniref:2-oxoglutarate and iron-dependent oxygenase domain-containing protein CP2-like isoform X1 n=1 Tax=Arachis stenosperma TaxID=217475 RepID=UPI0025AD82EB|nr:2-oxoglutarate and iron-dependent oxygenase domain-containing protein CP2-like isoform X1 [Arachis stenosperma]